jgi:catechol 2,3-dioxygenase-like lactoylglutathione lyase family enzyme
MAQATLGRRQFLIGVPTLLATRRLLAQASAKPIRLHAYSHVALTVSDPKRSIDFYQGLFGLSVLTRAGDGGRLQIRTGPQYLGVSANAANPTPRVDHFCFSVEAFTMDDVLSTLHAHGVDAVTGRPGPMQVAKAADAPEVTVGDPDGIRFQLADAKFSRGSSPQAATTRGLLPAKDFSHVTVYVSDAARSNVFYRDLLGMSIRSMQGPSSPALAVGSGVQFAMFAAGGGRATRPPSINHVCLSVERFDQEAIVKALESYGIKPRENQTGSVGPLRHYVTVRKEDRGGAKEGTPELYFTDPDGIIVQVQDVSYCGGAGYLGNVCTRN